MTKFGVIGARHRDEINLLTEFYSADRFVFIHGKFTTALHQTAQIDYNRYKLYNKSQENACRSCRAVGHLASDSKNCPAYTEVKYVINIRSPNCIYSN